MWGAKSKDLRALYQILLAFRNAVLRMMTFWGPITYSSVITNNKFEGYWNLVMAYTNYCKMHFVDATLNF